MKVSWDKGGMLKSIASHPSMKTIVRTKFGCPLSRVKSWAWWCMLIIPDLGKLEQVGLSQDASLIGERAQQEALSPINTMMMGEQLRKTPNTQKSGFSY